MPSLLPFYSIIWPSWTACLTFVLFQVYSDTIFNRVWCWWFFHRIRWLSQLYEPFEGFFLMKGMLGYFWGLIEWLVDRHWWPPHTSLHVGGLIQCASMLLYGLDWCIFLDDSIEYYLFFSAFQRIPFFLIGNKCWDTVALKEVSVCKSWLTPFFLFFLYFLIEPLTDLCILQQIEGLLIFPFGITWLPFKTSQLHWEEMLSCEYRLECEALLSWLFCNSNFSFSLFQPYCPNVVYPGYWKHWRNQGWHQ